MKLSKSKSISDSRTAQTSLDTAHTSHDATQIISDAPPIISDATQIILSETNEPRLRLQHLRASGERSESSSDSLARDVRQGLSAPRKFLLPKYFYDELGSVLFDAICLLPEYYPTRAEEEILARYGDEIVRAAIANRNKQTKDAASDDLQTQAATNELTLLELGSGSATKTVQIIEAILRVQPTLEFTPVDISATALERSARVLLQAYENLNIKALAADYFTALDYLSTDSGCAKENAPLAKSRKKVMRKESSRRKLVLFLGSNIGNFDAAGALEFLRRLRETLRAGDALLLGADLRKEKAILQAAYDDSLGVTAAFNRNILARLNRELDADFDLQNFHHVARYDETAGRVEMFLESLQNQKVKIKKLELTIDFKQGERIHTESSYKYDLPTLVNMSRTTGFELAQTWFDRHQRFSSNLLIAV